MAGAWGADVSELDVRTWPARGLQSMTQCETKDSASFIFFVQAL